MRRLFWSDMIGHWFMAYGDWNRSFSCMRRSTKTLSAFFSLLKRFVHGNLASGSGLLCETMINWFHYSFKHLFDDVLAWKTIGQWVSEKPKSINPGLSDQRLVFSQNSRVFFTSMMWYHKPNLAMISIKKRFQAKLLASLLPRKADIYWLTWLETCINSKISTQNFVNCRLQSVVTLGH